MNHPSLRGLALSRRRQREEALWEAADTFDLVCDLAARWIEGGLIHHPGYGADTVDDETMPIRDTLAAVNRAGYLTHDSEPAASGDNLYGVTDQSWRRRANVSGWIADSALLGLVRNACREYRLWMMTAPRGHGTHTGRYWTFEADGVPEDVQHTNDLTAPGPDDIWFSEAAVEQVLDATWVRIIDSRYDEGGGLWMALDHVARIHASRCNR